MHTPAHLPAPSGASGFTAVELLVALFITAVVLLPLASLELRVEDQLDRAEVESFALLRAEEKLEELLAVPYDELASGEDVLVLQGERRLARTWTVLRDQPRAGLSTVVVSIIERAVADASRTVAPPLILSGLRRLP